MLCSVVLLAQKEVKVIETNFKGSGFNNKESLAISNKNTGELVILVEDSKYTKLYLFDTNFKLKAELKTDRLQKNFKSFVGYSIDNDVYSIVFTDNKIKRFGILSFNFKTKTLNQDELVVDFEKEKYIKSLTHNDTFYIITASKKSEKVHFYSLSNDKTFKKKTIPFDHFVFANDQNYKKYPVDLFRSVGWFGSGSIVRIDSNSPNSIENTSSKNKLYQTKNELIFTTDVLKGETRIIKVDMNDFSVTSSSFEKPVIFPTEPGFPVSYKHNSFIHNGILYQLSINSKEMKFVAIGLDSKTKLKEINLKKEDSITFKNGPIIQEGGSSFQSARIRKLEKTSKFLRKVGNSDVGITAYKKSDTLQLTIGGYIVVQSSGAPILVGGGGAIGGAISGAAFALSSAFNPTFGAYGAYSSTKSTYIDCKFDKDFKHIEGDRLENAFDKIKIFEDNFVENYFSNNKNIKKEDQFGKITPRMKLKNVFYHNNKYI